MSMYVIQQFLMVAVAVGGVYMDLKEERVDNSWICLGWMWGSLWQLWFFGVRGMWVWVAGFLIPLLLLYPLFYLRMLGAADLKLLSALGGFLGPHGIICCVGYSFCAGAVLALAILVVRRSLVERLHYFFQYIQSSSQMGELRPYGRPGRRPENLHFTVPILAGVLFWIGGHY